MSASATLAVKIISDFDNKGMRSAESATQRLGRAADTTGKVLAGGLVAGGVAAIAAFEKGSTANARLEQTLKNTAGATDSAIQATQSYASELGLLTGVDDDVIKGGQAILGTFDQISGSAGEVGGIFERATAASVDLAAAGFGSVESNANGLGKALQDPIKGMALLTKQGTLTKDQQEEIATAFEQTGDIAAAQNSILEALEGQVQGTGEATADATAVMRESADEAFESIGEALAPALQTAAEKAQELSVWVQENQGKVQALVAAIAGYVAIWAAVKGIMVAVKAATLAYHAVMLIIQAATKVWTGIQIALNVAMMLNPVGLLVAAIVALIAIVVAIVVATRDKWMPALEKLWDLMKQAATWVKDRFVEAFNFLKEKVSEVWEKIKEGFAKARDKLVEIGENIREKLRAVVDFIKADWEAFREKVSAIVERVREKFRAVVDRIKSIWQGLSDRLASIGATIREKFQAVVDKVKSIWQSGMDRIRGVIDRFKSTVSNVFGRVKSIVTGAFDAVRRGIDRAISAIRRIMRWFGNLADKARDALSNLNPFSGGGFLGGLFGRSAVPAAASAGTFSRLGGGLAGTARSAGPVTINVNGAGNPYDTARIIKRAIEGYDYSQGRTVGAPLKVAW